MNKQNLAIITNEKTYFNNNSYFCDNIDMKSIPEGLDSKYNLQLFVRNSKLERSTHQINLKNIFISQGILSYIFGKNRSKKKIIFNKNTGGQPSHYGYYCLIWVTVPSVIFFLLWQVSSNHFIDIATINSIPKEILPKDVTLQKLLLENIIIVAKGGKSLAEVPSESVDYFRKLKFISTVASYSSTLIISLIFCFLSFL